MLPNPTQHNPIIFKEEVYAIVGAAMEVHSTLGSGFLESVYEEALCFELSQRKIPFQKQVKVAIFYKGEKLQKEFIVDLIAFDKIIIELKTLKQLSNIEEAQILNYLKATSKKVGLLINFGNSKKLEWKRFVY